MKNVLLVLGCLLALVAGVAAQDPNCPRKITDEDEDCPTANGDCALTPELLFALEKCPEGGNAEAPNKHPTILMPDKREFVVESTQVRQRFKIANIKEYYPHNTPDGPACDWDSYPFEPKNPPFKDNIPGGLTAYSTVHDLTLIPGPYAARMACYKLDLIFQGPTFAVQGESDSVSGEIAVDPHIQTGNPAATLPDTRLYQECYDATQNKKKCNEQLAELSKAR